MQCIYALTQSKDNSLEKQEKFLRYSIESMYTLYLLMLSLLVEIQKKAAEQVKLSSKKYLANTSDSFPDKKKFVNNRLLVQLANNELLKEELKKRKLNNWYLNDEYVRLLYKEMVESDTYTEYMYSTTSSFAEDKEFVSILYKDLVAPNEKIYDYFEDDRLTWVDDFPIVNTFVLKLLKKVKENHHPVTSYPAC